MVEIEIAMEWWNVNLFEETFANFYAFYEERFFFSRQRQVSLTRNVSYDLIVELKIRK